MKTNSLYPKIVSSIVGAKVVELKQHIFSMLSNKTHASLVEKKAEIAQRLYPLKKKIVSPINEDIVGDIKGIVDSNELSQVQLNNGESVSIDVPTASILLTILNALDDENKNRMIDLMSSDAKNFLKVVDFGWKNIE